ncbi:ATP-binding protein [Streptantibioticus parmotrematis]|uniref:ATP-binding protein n=1 Tax=Streptantibioticus parmotrematis TaxID=2873249 RepID=UPI0033E6AB0D
MGRARRWNRDIPRDHPAADDAALIVTELSANAIFHTASGDPTGTFHLTVDVTPTAVTIAMTDHGTPKQAPHVERASTTATHGRGLAIVTAFADHVEVRGGETGRKVIAHLVRTPIAQSTACRRATGTATAYRCVAVVHGRADGTAYLLSRDHASTPRLALRCLRSRVRDIAEQLHPPYGQPHRYWLTDEDEHECVLRHLAASEPYLLTAYDDTTRYVLTACPAGGAR